ncbi:MAG: tRNA (N(6)-L-threonylcarbamoyladenosine(37)-C(2))-methylthiotransferase MtaB [Phycisphaerae bacterium]|nr:tRNA (N(6)-L-threonylcarbamoyladenosine(37)-C(2))-methylthiotransferase MtaB [Phycisphaerae bacterium]
MKTFSISTLGCKVNQYESQQIRQFLQQHGLSQADSQENPDLAIVNTCGVTSTASAKSRHFVRKIQRLWPQCTIIVCGCLPVTQDPGLTEIGENVHFVQDRQDLAAELTHRLGSATSTQHSDDTLSMQSTVIKTESPKKINPGCKTCKSLPPLTRFQGHTRAFLKVQDGCDGRCAYCIIPQTRPNLISRPVQEIVDEAQALVENGHKEIVVTGVFLGAYGQTTVRRAKWPNQTNPGLARLLDRLAQVKDLPRIRLSSLEPGDLTPDLIQVLASHRNIMPHIHLSLQSGSDTVLKRMGRQYSRSDFEQVVEAVKDKLDRPALTTDIIAGFPGETDREFQDTVDLATQTGFSKMHVFAFSARKGTAAAKMPHPIPGPVIRERSDRLRQLDIELAEQYRQRFLNEPTTVLIEEVQPFQCSGLSERYFKVVLPQPENKYKKNDLVTVRLKPHHAHGLITPCQELESHA